MAVIANNAETMKRRKPVNGFKPGKSGNPSGRPKIRKDLQSLCQQSTQQNVDNLMEIACSGEPMERIAAIKLLWAYGYGMPTQAVNHSGAEGQPLKLYVEFSPADWEASTS